MSEHSSRKVRLLRQLILQSLRAQSALASVGDVLEVCTGALLNAMTSDEEKEQISIELYDRSFNPRNDIEGLYDWEERWFERRLPKTPARILVGGAGGGREAKVLQDRGYTVCILEPSPRAAASCAKRLGADAAVIRACYRDFADGILNGDPEHIGLSSDSQFDAVLLGWGSFGHVLASESRYRLLAACDAVAPKGPILLSVFRPPKRRLAGRRAEAGERPVFVSWGGFLVEPTVEELAEHCKKLGRELIGDVGATSPYFTLAPGRVSTVVSASERSPKLAHEKIERRR